MAKEVPMTSFGTSKRRIRPEDAEAFIEAQRAKREASLPAEMRPSNSDVLPAAHLTLVQRGESLEDGIEGASVVSSAVVAPLHEAPATEPLSDFVELRPLLDEPIEGLTAPLAREAPLDATSDRAEVDVVLPNKKAARPSLVPAQKPEQWRKKVVGRKNGREARKQTFYLDAEVSHSLAVLCAQLQYPLSEAVEEAIVAWIDERKRAPS